MYNYKAELVRIVDSDTFYFNVDLGLNTNRVIDVRLAFINCPEIRGKQKVFGKKLTKYVSELFELHNNKCEIITHKKGKFGRYVASVYFKYNGFSKSLKTLILSEYPEWFIKSDSKIYDYVFNKGLLK